MIIYTDLISKDELFSDSFPSSIEDDVIMRVEVKMIRKGGETIDIGANPSAEGEDEDGGAGGADEGYEVLDVVDGYRLENTVFDKKNYVGHIKEYMKALKAHLQEKNPDRVAAFEQGAQAYVKKVVANFSKYDFYVGETMDPEAMTILYEEAEDGKKYLLFWKDGLCATKC